MKKYEWEVRIMAFLEELSKKLSDVSRVVGRKAKEVTDIGGLKIQIADEKRKVNKLYENLGRKYFEEYQDAPLEAVTELVEQIKAGLEKISALEEDVLKVEAESAAKAEADRVRREAEALARKEAVAESEIVEVVDEDEAEVIEPDEAEEETVSGEPEAAPEEPADGAEE